MACNDCVPDWLDCLFVTDSVDAYFWSRHAGFPPWRKSFVNPFAESEVLTCEGFRIVMLWHRWTFFLFEPSICVLFHFHILGCTARAVGGIDSGSAGCICASICASPVPAPLE